MLIYPAKNSAMKNHIFISMHYMELGGAESALIGILQSFDYSKYNVDLFLHSHRGELMSFIPKEVNLLPEIPAYTAIEKPMKEVLFDCLKFRNKNDKRRVNSIEYKDERAEYRDKTVKNSDGDKGYTLKERISMLHVLYGRIKAKWNFRKYARNNHPKDNNAIYGYVGKYVTPYLPSLRHLGEYDLAISFLTPHNIVLEKVQAKKKLAWIHTDYSRIDVNAQLELPVWNGYDKIVSISPDVTKTFLQTFPSLAPKVIEIENILSPEFIWKRAEETTRERETDRNELFYPNTILNSQFLILNLLSIGRYTYQKNFDNVPDICKQINSQLSILNSLFRVRWYLIGYGGDEVLIRQKIVEAGMQDHVIILGKKSNPYPYIKACDIYVQPSRYEGKSITVREAQILCKPVVITNYATAPSQIKDGVDGVIVPMDNEGCAKGIVDFILDTKLQKNIVDHLNNHDYGNTDEIHKIDKLIS